MSTYGNFLHPKSTSEDAEASSSEEAVTAATCKLENKQSQLVEESKLKEEEKRKIVKLLRSFRFQ